MRSLLVSVLLLCPALAGAAEPYETPDLVPAFLKMLGGLAVIVGILLAMYALNRKWGLFTQSRKGEIQILETRQLGNKRALCLARARGRDLLIGLGQERIELLADLGQGPAFDEELSRKRYEEES
jgi:flagellar protein FliO/FliZ